MYLLTSIFPGRMPAGTKSAGFRGQKTQDGYVTQSRKPGRVDRQDDMYNMQWPPFDNVIVYFWLFLFVSQ